MDNACWMANLLLKTWYVENLFKFILESQFGAFVEIDYIISPVATTSSPATTSSASSPVLVNRQ